MLLKAVRLLVIVQLRCKLSAVKSTYDRYYAAYKLLQLRSIDANPSASVFDAQNTAPQTPGL